MQQEKDLSRQILSDIIIYMKYARYNKNKKRRETWEEIIDRYKKMMIKKYPKLKNEIEENCKYLYEKKVLPSMRALQFGGKAIEKNPARIYNCCALAISHPDAFKELAFLLMSGCGLGYSIQKQHVKQLPEIYKPTKSRRHLIGDSIEEWAIAIGALIDSYMGGRKSKPHFDFSDIRDKGEILKTSGGLAPGAEPLKNCLHYIENILERKKDGEKLSPLEVNDLCTHIADCVVVGGTRRSACISIFSFDDNEMIESKYNSWWINNPQRGRANNSAMIIRHKITEEEFNNYFNKIKLSKTGEPGWIFSNHSDTIVNPCQPKWAYVLTNKGLKTLDDIVIGDKIWSFEGWTTVIKKRYSGVVDVYKYETIAGIFYGTNNHKLISYGEKIKAEDCSTIDIFSGPKVNKVNYNWQDIMDGLIIGSGSKHKASNNLIFLTIGEKDQDYLSYKEFKKLLLKSRTKAFGKGSYEIITTIKKHELPKTYNRFIPERFIQGNSNKVCSFLRGLYSANGSICGNRVTLKASSKKLVEQVQLMLSSIGIISYYTTNKTQIIKFKNGKYKCKQLYDLNITVNRNEFYDKIGFIQKYKKDKLKNIIKKIKKVKHKKNIYDIKNIELVSKEKVFNIEVDNKSKTYWTQSCNVSNCAEISLKTNPRTGTGSMCNLCEINASNIVDQKDFNNRARIASFFATLQATFTDFHLLREEWKELVEKEALIGVSMTGIANSNVLNLNMKEAANIIKEENKRIADTIGINKASRCTTIKPGGCIVGNELIVTNKGIFEINELFINHPYNKKWGILNGFTIKNDNKNNKITKTYYNGSEKVYKIKFSFGFEIKCTAKHKWYKIGDGQIVNKTKNYYKTKKHSPEWIETCKLKKGDQLYVSLGEYKNKINYPLKDIDSIGVYYKRGRERPQKRIIFPSHMDDTLAWFFGYLWGDGAMSPLNYRFRFIDQYKMNLQKVQKIVKKYFNINASIFKCKNKNAYTLEFGSKPLWFWCLKNNIFKYYNNCMDIIPLCIRKSSKYHLLSFFAGLIDSDGGVYYYPNYKQKKPKITLCVSTAQTYFSKHLQDIMATVGILLGRSLNCKGENKQAIKHIYLLNCIYMLPEALKHIKKHSNKFLNKIKQYPKAEILFSTPPNYNIGTIKDITLEKKNELTFDIEIENSHWYNVNIFKSHNTSSLVLGSSSGINSYFAPYYIRRVRVGKNEPIYKYLVKNNPELIENDYFKPTTQAIISIPIKAPEGAIISKETALQFLERIKKVYKNWILPGHRNGYNTNNISATVYVKEHEWNKVQKWLWENRDNYTALSLFPYDDHTHVQAPFEEIDEQTYKKMYKKLKKIDLTKIIEAQDSTNLQGEVACAAGACEIQ